MIPLLFFYIALELAFIAGAWELGNHLYLSAWARIGGRR